MADRSSQIKKTLAEGGNVNQQNEQGRTFLHEAAIAGDLDLVEYLLSIGADINATDKDGKTPTDLAEEHPQLSLLLRALGGVRLETTTFTPSAHVDLASEKIGGKVLWANDEFFASADNLIKPGRGVFQFGVFTDKGQLMDGWESARHGAIRRGGKDSCYIKLGAPGIVRGFDIDTNNFTGNYAAEGSVDAIFSSDDLNVEQLHHAKWIEILPRTKLGSSSQHFVSALTHMKCSHIRFNIYPDGGVARLRVYGDVTFPFQQEKKELELSSILLGGKVISVSDNYFSSQDNALMPNRGINMGDGWETRRSRIHGNTEWILLKLGKAGTVSHIEVDTNHFKGNFPESVTMDACYEGGEWKKLLERSKLEAHKQHFFTVTSGLITHVKVTIFPDGGISRIRIHGNPATVEEIKKHKTENSVKFLEMKDENFINFGEIVNFGNFGEKSLWRAKYVSGVPQFSTVKYRKNVPAKTLEKKQFPETFFPVTNSKWRIYVALNSKYGEKPDMFHFKAFEGKGAVNVKAGVWHSQPVPVEEDMDFMVMNYEGEGNPLVAKIDVHVQ